MKEWEELKSLGYELIEKNKNENLYSEISSHVDIFACKIKDKIIVENGLYKTLKSKLKNADFMPHFVASAIESKDVLLNITRD